MHEKGVVSMAKGQNKRKEVKKKKAVKVAL
jgi:hypothetical protein